MKGTSEMTEAPTLSQFGVQVPPTDLTVGQARKEIKQSQHRALAASDARGFKLNATDRDGTAWPFTVVAAHHADALRIGTAVRVLIRDRMKRERCATFRELWALNGNPDDFDLMAGGWQDDERERRVARALNRLGVAGGWPATGTK